LSQQLKKNRKQRMGMDPERWVSDGMEVMKGAERTGGDRTTIARELEKVDPTSTTEGCCLGKSRTVGGKDTSKQRKNSVSPARNSQNDWKAIWLEVALRKKRKSARDAQKTGGTHRLQEGQGNGIKNELIQRGGAHEGSQRSV